MKTTILIIYSLLVSTVNICAQTWEFVGLDTMIIYGLDVKGDTIWAGTRDLSLNGKSGLYKSIDRGQNWVKLDSLLEDKTVSSFSIAENSNSDLYLSKGPGSGYLFRTTNDGLSWNTINTPGNAPIKDFIISPLSADEYYVVTHNIGHEWSILELFNKSTDAGNFWEFKCCPVDQEFGMAMNFAIDKTDPNILYISGSSAGKFFSKSIDRGETWQTLSDPDVARVFTDYFLPERIYLFKYRGQSFSNDGGFTWQPMEGEFSNDAIFYSFYQYEGSSFIYALMNEGLYFSNNDNIYWKLIPGSENLPLEIPSLYYSSTIRNISIDEENNLIYVGSVNGIYRTNFVTGISNQKPDLNPREFFLNQNYPNPFNPSTTITYQIPKTGFVTIKVYDVLGKEIATLINDEKPTGHYEVRFDAIGLPSGVYIYRITASNKGNVVFTASKQMILIK